MFSQGRGPRERLWENIRYQQRRRAFRNRAALTFRQARGVVGELAGPIGGGGSAQIRGGWRRGAGRGDDGGHAHRTIRIPPPPQQGTAPDRARKAIPLPRTLLLKLDLTPDTDAAG